MSREKVEQHIAAGNSNVALQEYDLAINDYTMAIEADPTCADAHLRRAFAALAQRDAMQAVEDAQKAVELEPTLVRAHFVKGQAYLLEEETEQALASILAGLQVDPSNVKLQKLLSSCPGGDQHLHALQQRLLATSQQQQNAPHASQAACAVEQDCAVAKPQTALQGAEGYGAVGDGNGAQPNGAAQNAVQKEPQPKYRHEHYQVGDKVVVDIFAKNKSQETATIDISRTSLHVSTKNENGEVDYELHVQLYAEVDPTRSKYDFRRPKIEIQLAKVNAAATWPRLQQSAEDAVATTQPAAYPTSRKTDFASLEKQAAAQEEKPEGEAGLNAFFQEIYKNADEDARRAMMKSYVESGGTVLSTNWSDVGSKHVDVSPPEGMEVKKWEM